MTIKVGDRVPSAKLWHLTPDGVKDITTDDLFRGKRVALFAVPGAYTRTCSTRHLPSYVNNAAALKAKGIDTIACLAVNDAFVMGAWGKEHGADGKIMMLGDGSADFTRAIGLDLDRISAGMGIRSQRYSMLVEDGIVKQLNVEPSGEYGVSGGEAMLEKL
ncbi:MAG TPA: peroxiredoxin [Stellaceae bacterium]|nr:peroxiredoxin [Stellaceae bacterium]